MHIFHKWSKWEKYEQSVIEYPGIIAPKNMRGKPIENTQLRQKRLCEKCGYLQDKEIYRY